MIYFISKTTTTTYRRILKPLLFKQKPDAVHKRLLRTGSVVQRSAPLMWAFHGSLAYSNEAALSQTIEGIYFKNPVGLSAGFDKNFELVPLMKAVGYGFMEGGSLTYRPCQGNPRPWFYRLPKTKSLVVHVGLANKGVHQVIANMEAYSSRSLQDFPLNISVAKTNSPEACTESDAIDDYIGSLLELQKAAVGDMYTLNISCPNTYGGEPFTTPERLEHLLAAVDKLKLTKPLFIKMPIDLPWNSFQKLVAVADKHQVAGLTIGNLAKDRKAANLQDELPDSMEGGMSGKPTWELSNDLIRRTYQNYKGRFVIIGVGGIFSAEDAYEKIKNGANVVELITGMIFEGPQLIGQINRDLVHLLAEDGYANISQAVGKNLA